MARLRISGGPGDAPAIDVEAPQFEPAIRPTAEQHGHVRRPDSVDELIHGRKLTLDTPATPSLNSAHPLGRALDAADGTEMASLWPKGMNLPSMPLRMLGNLLDAAKRQAEDFGKDQINKIPVKLRLNEIDQVLENRDLKDTMVARARQQLKDQKVVVIGVIDDFRPGQTHGRNVVERILTNAPNELKGKIVIVPYDIGGLKPDERAQKMMDAANDAKSGRLIALSVSGGLNPYSVDAIQQWTKKPLNAATAEHAYHTITQKAVAYGSMTQKEVKAFDMLNDAGKTTPVVSPIWNDRGTTLAALSPNIIVTTIDKHRGSRATEIPGLADISVDPQFKNHFASQSAPTAIGHMLHLINGKK